MKTITFFVVLLFFCANINPLQAQEIILKEKGFVDVYYTSGNINSLNIPKEKEFKMNFGDPININYGLSDKNALANASTFAIRFRAWTILGELVTHPTVMWSINKQFLNGQKYQVQFSKISKYPDLVKRYNSIRPVSIKAIVGMGLNPKNNFDGGAYAWFKITDNDVIIEKSNVSPLTFPTAPINSGEGVQISTDDNKMSFLSDFSRFVTADRPLELTKFLKNATSVANFAWVKLSQGEARKNDTQFNQNIYLDVKWPLAAIDEIEELYAKYEKGEKSPQEKLDEELKNANNTTFNNNDEWSEPFEDKLKNVEIFENGSSVGLKSGTRIIASFSKDKYTQIKKLKSSNYYSLSGRSNSLSTGAASIIIDKKGNIQNILNENKFDFISQGNENEIEVYTYENLVYSKKVMYPILPVGSYLPSKYEPSGWYASLNEPKNKLDNFPDGSKNYSVKPRMFRVYKLKCIIVDKNLQYKSTKYKYDCFRDYNYE